MQRRSVVSVTRMLRGDAMDQDLPMTDEVLRRLRESGGL
jgi:hypothetical protein